ncbi:Pheromone receptor [Mycena sanguinolenta]|uniref:Pheromone receptor n=1 Tax=Mycena sanguinolenta TaxID=230812 RepID=A0A8H6Z9G6_9AGAR|nr:Pheromone receptor [Mycena sanguinolenta]
MLLVLPVLSFLCAGLLAVFLILLIRRPAVNTANVSIALWLLLGNGVHAINAIVWSSNVELRIPVWCDIVTKLLLGITVALPGVCLCSARYLELLSSTRKIYPNTYSKRIHTLIDVALCFVLPLLYMILHFAVQDHRFDLVQNFGCSASIQRSTPAVLIMVIPPLILCSISLLLCMLSIWNCARISAQHFAQHLSARSALSAPIFIRRLTKSTLLTATVLIVTLFPLLGPHTESWASFHANFSVIYIVQKPIEVLAEELEWWSVPVVSLVYLALSLVLGEETPNILNWILRGTRFGHLVPAPIQRPPRPELSLLTFSHSMAAKSSSLSLVTPTLTTPEPVQLRSGWDEMLDVKTGSRRGQAETPAFLASPDRRSAVSDSAGYSPTAGPISPEEEDAFTSSTLTYLASPVAQALGLESPISPTAASPSAAAVPLTPSSTSKLSPTPSGRMQPSPLPLLATHLHPPRQPIPEDTASTISSIWDAPWPLPPASPVQLPARVQSPTLALFDRTRFPATPPGIPPPPRRAQSMPRKPVVRPLKRSETLARTDGISMTRTVETV